MKIKPLVLVLAAIFSTTQLAVSQTQAPPAPTSTAKAADVQSIDAIPAATYDTISGPAGTKRDWSRFRSLFYPGARLIPTGKRQGDSVVRSRVITPDEYVERARANIEKQGFFERSISNHVDRYDNIAQVFSTYESRHSAEDAKPFPARHQQLSTDARRPALVDPYDHVGRRNAGSADPGRVPGWKTAINNSDKPQPGPFWEWHPPNPSLQQMLLLASWFCLLLIAYCLLLIAYCLLLEFA